MPKTENSKSIAKDDDSLLCLINSLKLRNSKTIEVKGSSNGSWINTFIMKNNL